MSESAVVLGFALGLRHATDADHLAAISTLLGGRGVRGAITTAGLWGLGHSATFWGLGLAIVASGVRLPASYERGFDLLVAAMLVGLGGWQIWRLRRGSHGEPAHGPEHASAAGDSRGGTGRWRPMLVGVIHGLAGSAGVALVALMTLPTRLGALLYLLLFGLGVVAGMMLLTALMSWPLAWSARRSGGLHRGVQLVVSVASVGTGLAVALGS